MLGWLSMRVLALRLQLQHNGKTQLVSDAPILFVLESSQATRYSFRCI